MTDDDWDNWTDFYSRCFSLISPGDAGMFAAWREVFEASGYSAHELDDAAKAIAKDPPRFRTDHLARIHARIRERRFAVRAMQEQQQQQDQFISRCNLCSNSGFATVPHLAYVSDGEWLAPWREYAVLCACSKGVSIADNQRRHRQDWESGSFTGKSGTPPKVQMRLTDYEGRNSNWCAQVMNREKVRAAEAKAKMASRGADHHLLAKGRKAIQGIVSNAARLRVYEEQA